MYGIIKNGMNGFSKFAVKLCFTIWLITAILPTSIFMHYRIMALLFEAGRYISIGIFVMAVTVYVLPLLLKRERKAISKEKTRLILHDLDIEMVQNLFTGVQNTHFFCANRKMASCHGWYGCWLQTPGICVMHDGVETLGKQIAFCDEFIIISKNLYGGYSQQIKNALDRSISFALPFFRVYNNEQHHQPRYENTGNMKVIVYNSNEISDSDKASLIEITKANSINMNKSNYETIFVHDVKELKEVSA